MNIWNKKKPKISSKTNQPICSNGTLLLLINWGVAEFDLDEAEGGGERREWQRSGNSKRSDGENEREVIVRN